jgi:MFS family permease
MNNQNNITLGLKANLNQFILLVIINAFVGAMVGLERTLLPILAKDTFQIASTTAILSFIISFGVVKAFTNLFAGRLSDKIGRKGVLVTGWIVAIPIPFLIIFAPDWSWIIAANILLGINQGLTWSTTVIMKIDLAGPKNRGLAMGINEFAGYFAVAMVAFASGYIASVYGIRPYPFYLGIGFVFAGLILSAFFVRETHHHAKLEAQNHVTHTSMAAHQKEKYSSADIFWLTSWKNKNLFSCSQAGLVNNLNDGMAWGLFPLFFAAASLDINKIGILIAVYPASWGLLQLFTGALSDKVGRKYMIVGGMITQAVGIWMIALTHSYGLWILASVLMGLGTAMVYPTLIAAIGDVAHPDWRASAVGVYRFWRDIGYAVGALIAGIIVDFFGGLQNAIITVGVITFISGILVMIYMRETKQG